MVRKFREGVYILMTIEGAGTVIHELERRLRVTEPVIKFMTVRIDEEQKRLEKIKKLRDARKKVSAQPAAGCGGSGGGNRERSAGRRCAGGQRLEPGSQFSVLNSQ